MIRLLSMSDQGTLNCYKRRLKSLTETIILLNTTNIYKYNFYGEIDDCITGIRFNIMTESNNIYDIEVWNTYGILNSACNCPDYIIKNNICKHIYWLGSSKFNSMDSCNWTTKDYNSIIVENWLAERTSYIGRNDTCPICLDHIDYQNDMTLCCIYQCQNAVHTQCWKNFYYMTDKNKCVMCRANIMPTITNF